VTEPRALAAAAVRLRGKPGRPRKPEASSRGEARSLPANTFPPRLLDVDGAARYLAISAWSVRGLCAAGKLPRVRLPLRDERDLRRLLFDVADLNHLIERAKEGAP